MCIFYLLFLWIERDGPCICLAFLSFYIQFSMNCLPFSWGNHLKMLIKLWSVWIRMPANMCAEWSTSVIHIEEKCEFYWKSCYLSVCVCVRTNRSDCHAKRWQKRLLIFSAGFVICIEVTLLSIKNYHLQRSHNRICLVKLLWNFFIQLEFVDWHCILSSGNEEKQTNTDWALRGALLCVQTKYLFEKNRWIGIYHSIQFD